MIAILWVSMSFLLVIIIGMAGAWIFGEKVFFQLYKRRKPMLVRGEEEICVCEHNKCYHGKGGSCYQLRCFCQQFVSKS